ncbi:hypothetical protein DB346_23640 [Verrucomicrobia bacterium LW23]|nr:hypothetical protein DB346_23640 [Verrucomicrobia bacterium LW23]
MSDVPELPVFPEAVAPAESEAVASLPPVPEEPEIPVFESTPGPVAVELPPVPEFTPVVSPPEVPDAQQDAAVVAHSDALSPLPPAPVADSQAEEAPVAADPLPEFPPLLPEPAIESIAAEPEAFLPPPPVEESAAYAFGAPAGEGWAELPPPPADEPEDQQLPPVPEEFAAAVPPVPQEDVAFAPPPVPEFGEMPPPPPDFEELPPVPTDDAASGEPALPGFPDIPPPPSAEDDAAQVPAVPEFPPADIPGLPPLPAEMGVTPSDRRSSRPSLLGAEPTRITKLSRKPEHLLTRRRSKTLTGGTSFGRLPEDGGAEDQGGSVNAVEAGTSTDQGTETGQGRFTRRAGDGSGRMAPPRELAGARKPKAAVPAGPPRTLAQMALWVSAHMLLWCGLFVLLVAMWVSTVLYFRETRVEGVIIPPPDTAKITEIFIVNDFSGDIGDLRTRLREQRAPLIARMQEREERIANIRREMEAKDEQVKRWLSEIEAKEAELKDVLANVVAERNKISKGPGSELMALYEQRQNALRQEIEERAQALNLENFKGTKEYPSPDVWLNNYSIALYGTPAATATKEKEWVQKKLSEWRDFVKYYEERAQEFASQLRAVEGVVGPKKQEVTQVTEELRARISEAQQSIGPLKDEIARVEVDQTADRGVEATLDQNFLLELQGMPDLHKKRSIAVDNNRFSLRHLQKKETGRLREWEVGTYRAFVRINVGGEENWAIGEFPIQDYDTTRVIIPPAAFEPILKILKDGLD